jgi:hypothetical protein
MYNNIIGHQRSTKHIGCGATTSAELHEGNRPEMKIHVNV